MRAIANSHEAAKMMPDAFGSENSIGVVDESAERQTATESDTWFPALSSFFQRVNMPEFTRRRKRRVTPTQEVVESHVNIVSNWIADQYIYDPRAYIEKYRLRVFQKMMLQSPDTKAALTLKKLSVLSDDWDVYSSEKNEGSDKHSDFVKWNLTNIPGGFNKVIDNILDGLKYGFSLSEKVYDYIPNGTWKGLLGYEVIRDKPVFDFTIDTNNKGEVLGFVQSQEFRGETVIPPWKLVYWPYQATSDNPYGYSDLCPAFQHVFAQSVMDESWPTALKRYAMPIVVVEERGTAHEETSRKNLEEVMKRIKEETGIILPYNIQDVRYLEQGGSNAAYQAYQKHQEYRARQIRLSCLVPDLMISEGTRTGSKSMSQTHMKGFTSNIIPNLRQSIAYVVNEQVVKPLVDFNFENVDEYPVFTFGSSEHEDNEILAGIFNDFIQNGIATLEEDRPWIREKFGIPSKNLKKGFVPDVGSNTSEGNSNNSSGNSNNNKDATERKMNLLSKLFDR